MGRVLLDLGPQPLHVHVHETAVAEIGVAPDELEQLLASEHLTGVPGELVQQPELGDGQCDLLGRAAHGVGVGVDGERTQGEEWQVQRRPRLPAAPRRRLTAALGAV